MLRHKFKRWREERRELQGLKQGVESVQKKYAPLLESAEGDYKEVVVGEYIDELNEYAPELQYRQSPNLIRKARRVGILIGQEDENWIELPVNPFSNRRYKSLSELGEVRLRNLILKHHRETVEWWFKVIGGLTGLIGTLIGLVAVWKRL